MKNKRVLVLESGSRSSRETQLGSQELPENEHAIFMSRLNYYPGANLHGFGVRIDNSPGALLHLVEAIAKENLNITGIEAFSVPNKDQSSMYVVVDFTGEDKSPKDLETIIRNVPSIRSVTHIEPLVIGFLADTLHFPLYLTANGRRCFIVTDLFWQSFLKTGYDKTGIEASKLFFYQAGVNLGRASALVVRESLHLEDEEIIRVLLHQGKALGWWEGKGEVNLLRNHLDLKLWHNWEGEYAKKWSVGCHAVRGFWEGAISEILQKRVQITEVSCISRNKEYCEFRLTA